MTEKTIDEAEARRILEDLARHGPPTAKVASIKVLREMDKDARAEEIAARESRAFEELHPELYEDEISCKQREREARAKNGGRAA